MSPIEFTRGREVMILDNGQTYEETFPEGSGFLRIEGGFATGQVKFSIREPVEVHGNIPLFIDDQITLVTLDGNRKIRGI